MEQSQQNPNGQNNAGQNNPQPDSLAVANGGVSVGGTLRIAREQLGLSVMEAANLLKFAPRQIEALEADDFQQLQGATFLRGFVRGYAKILQLDAQPLLEGLPTDNPLPQQIASVSVGTPFPDLLPARRQNFIWLGAALLLVVIVVSFAVWNVSSPLDVAEVLPASPQTRRVETPVALPDDIKIISDLAVPEARVASLGSVVPPEIETEKQTAKNAQPVIQETKLPSDAVVSKNKSIKSARQAELSNADTSQPTSTLRLVFGDESWTEIKDRDGEILVSQINQPGSELRLNGRPPFSLLIGRALSVRLYQDDEPVDLTHYVNKHSEVAHLTLE